MKNTNKKIKKIIKEADEKCPFPYTRIDSTMEEYASQIGAVSLEDFIKKINNKYGV